jgi:uncharacterized protein (DUF1330 family)
MSRRSTSAQTSVSRITSFVMGRPRSAIRLAVLSVSGCTRNAASANWLKWLDQPLLPYGGKWLVLDAQVHPLEGEWPGSLVLMEFPEMETAQKWYNSPEYQKILHLRTDNAISDLMLADQVGPGFTSAAWAQQIRTAIAAGSGLAR